MNFYTTLIESQSKKSLHQSKSLKKLDDFANLSPRSYRKFLNERSANINKFIMETAKERGAGLESGINLIHEFAQLSIESEVQVELERADDHDGVADDVSSSDSESNSDCDDDSDRDANIDGGSNPSIVEKFHDGISTGTGTGISSALLPHTSTEVDNVCSSDDDDDDGEDGPLPHRQKQHNQSYYNTAEIVNEVTSSMLLDVNTERANNESVEVASSKSTNSISNSGERAGVNPPPLTTTEAVAPTKAKPLPIVDYSDHFQSWKDIFTANFLAVQSDKCADEYDCTSTVEKIYAVWLNIMSDYETAFIADKAESKRITTAASRKRYYRIAQNKSEVYSVVSDGIKKLKSKCEWTEMPTGYGLQSTWNLLWTWSKPKIDYNTLLCWQKVNHFPGSKALTRKDLLKKNLTQCKRIGGKMSSTFDIIPETYTLPGEYLEFVNAFTKGAETKGAYNYWILKPVGLSRGRGIMLITDISDVKYGDSCVIQEYLHEPYLLDGYKFDLRLYILVTSFDPLEAFIYDEGFARLSTVLYSRDPSTIKNLMMHLTNYSIQKSNTGALQADSENPTAGASEEEAGASKISLAFLKQKLSKNGIDVDALWKEIHKVVIKSLVSVDGVIPHHRNCFEVFGYDVLIDRRLRPWLIEVNSSPSMARDTALDSTIKTQLIADTINLVDPLVFNREKLVECCRRRLEDLTSSRSKPYSSKAFDSGAKVELNRDITDILQGKAPRAHGEMPANLGKYIRLIPGSAEYEEVMKVKRMSSVNTSLKVKKK